MLQAMKRVLHYLMGLESQLRYEDLNQEAYLEINSLMGWLLCLKSVILKGYEEQKRDRSVPQ